MKIIFLDVDGVVNSERSFLAGSERYENWKNADDPYFVKITRATIDPIAVDLINRLCTDAKCKLVISSTHRKHIPDGADKLLEMRKYFRALGFKPHNLIDWTPTLRGFRGDEIQAWLDLHPEVTHYVIIDDSADMRDEQLSNFVRVDPLYGFSAANFYQALHLLEAACSTPSTVGAAEQTLS